MKLCLTVDSESFDDAYLHLSPWIFRLDSFYLISSSCCEAITRDTLHDVRLSSGINTLMFTKSANLNCLYQQDKRQDTVNG